MKFAQFPNGVQSHGPAKTISLAALLTGLATTGMLCFPATLHADSNQSLTIGEAPKNPLRLAAKASAATSETKSAEPTKVLAETKLADPATTIAPPAKSTSDFDAFDFNFADEPLLANSAAKLDSAITKSDLVEDQSASKQTSVAAAAIPAAKTIKSATIKTATIATKTITTEDGQTFTPQSEAELLAADEEFDLELNEQDVAMADEPKAAEKLPEQLDIALEEHAEESVATIDTATSDKPVMRKPRPILIESLEAEVATQKPARNSVKVSLDDRSARGSLSARETTPSRIAMDPAMQYRAARVEATLQYYIDNPESITVRSPWAVMHTLLPFGVETEVLAGPQRVNAIGWMCSNRVCRTQTIFRPVGNSFRPNVGDGMQGHDGQFMAMLAQSQVASSYPISVNRRDFTIANLVQYEMATCRPKSELTFKLIGLSYYIGTKQSWMSNDRQRWNVERLLSEEMAQPINGAACGGTHRLMGIAFAVNQRKADKLPLSGYYASAERYVEDYKDYAWSLQNRDGSFSTNWLESRGADPAEDRKVQTTGHLLEWLIYSSSAAELEARPVNQAIDYLISQVYDHRDKKWAIGPRGHALRAILLYRRKMLQNNSQFVADSSMATRNSTVIR